MAILHQNGYIQFKDGHFLEAGKPITSEDFLELVQILPKINPALGGGGGGFSIGGGGRGAQGARGPAGPAGPAGVGLDSHVESAQSFYAEAIIADTTPVFPSMIYNGQAVSEIDVPAGQKLVITDAFFGFGFLFWTIEVDFGSGFTPIANFGFTLIAPITTEVKCFKSPITIVGGPGVKIRVKATAATLPDNPIDASITLRIYTEPLKSSFAASSKTPTVITLTAPETSGGTEEILNMSENGGAPTLALSVPPGKFLEIDDFDVAAGGQPGAFRLQQTNDGSTWFTIGRLDVVGIGNGAYLQVNPFTPWRIDGGPNVAVRVAITTPGGPLPVASVLTGFRKN